MKKLNLVTLAAASILAIGGLATVTSCGDKKGGGDENDAGTIEGNGGGELVIGSPTLQIPFVKQMALNYNAKLTEKGEKTLTFKFRIAEENSVDSIPDWSTGPDVYAFPSDKINNLNENGALAPIGSTYKTNLEANLTQDAIRFATHGGKIKGYPFAADNGYYLFYNKKIITDSNATKKIETLLDAAKAKNCKVAYNLTESFYTTGALVTFGANYKVHFKDNGGIQSVDSNFANENGVKAVKAIKKIMDHEAWQDKVEAPTEVNKIAACVDGSWNIKAYKEALGDDLGAVKMPTVTIDGVEKTLGSFIGYKLYGVNPQRRDNERLIKAHDFASYLVSKEVQEARFDSANIDPTDKNLRKVDKIKNNQFVKAIRDQVANGKTIEQTAVPGGIWDAGKTIGAGIKEGTITADNAMQALKNYDKALEAAK